MPSRLAEDHLISELLELDAELVITTQDAATYRHLVLAALDALAVLVKRVARLEVTVKDQQQQIAQLMGAGDDATRG